MFEKNTYTLRRSLLILTATLGTLSLGLLSHSFMSSSFDVEQMSSRLLPLQFRKKQVWETITVEEMRAGDTIQPHVNTLIFIPEEVERITRRTLFGRAGREVRYWGYCFPQTLEEMEALKRRGFPGSLFLSEKEREAQNETISANRQPVINTYDDLTEEKLNYSQRRQYSAIRHQKEVFLSKEVCYVMSNAVLAVGTDDDGDGANIEVEKQHNSDPLKKDTDGDGVLDGLEIFYLGTHPDIRDSDGDGIIDGIEDFNRNGRVDPTESNPMIWDSDRDSLCDGLCKVNNGTELRGEDKNLNGILDEGETSPINIDTDGDGILDEQEYYNCIAAGGSDC